MKKLFIILTATILFVANNMRGQDAAKFYIENGTKEAGAELDCATLKDLAVKLPATAKMFKYDRIDVTIEADMNEKFPGSTLQAIYVYHIYSTQKEFSIKFEGEKEIVYWLMNPKDGYGDFVGDDGNIRTGILCGSTPKEKVNVRFQMWAYVQTGEKENYNESTRTWEKQATYGTGTLLGEANVVVKQTADDMAGAKKAKMKRRFGL